MPLFELPLPLPRRTHYELLGIGPEATAEEILSASTRYVRRLEAEGADQDKIAEANAVNLAEADARRAYDAERPPLELLRLEPSWPGVFENRPQCLAVLRRELENFLIGRDVSVYHPTDLTRRDFTGDFSYSALLDGPERT